MKKIMFFGGLLLSAMTFVACTDEYDDWAAPQSNPQEETAEALPGYTATGVSNVIDLNTVTTDNVNILSLSTVTLPEGAVVGNTRVTFIEGETSATINVDSEGNVAKTDLQSFIETAFGKKALERTLNGHVYSNIIIGSQAFYVDAGEISIKVIPAAPAIADYYYIIGEVNGWDVNNTDIALYKEDAAAAFSYTTKFVTGNLNFKFTADFNMGTWDGAYGSVETDKPMNGTLTDAGGTANISVPVEDTYYTVTVDVENMTYTWTELSNQSPVEYATIGIIGDFNGWGDDVDMNQVTPHNWYVETNISTAGGLKFRANDGWDISWGGSLTIGDSYYCTSIYGSSDNITVPAGTFRIYFNDITGQCVFVPVE